MEMLDSDMICHCGYIISEHIQTLSSRHYISPIFYRGSCLVMILYAAPQKHVRTFPNMTRHASSYWESRLRNIHSKG